jgi:hypothetical protein
VDDYQNELQMINTYIKYFSTITNVNMIDTPINDNLNDTTNVNTNDFIMDVLNEESGEVFEEDNTTEKSTQDPNFNEFQKPSKK